ncbi:hypothetical protein [Pasteurella testudinis]|nr:hypothetical protein [Pasteurella testudinis]SUB51587.1 Uncharacterised protein [Pasteurella testudinis]
MSKITIDKNKYDELLADRKRLRFIQKNRVSIIYFGNKCLAAAENIGLFVERENIWVTIDDAMVEFEDD